MCADGAVALLTGKEKKRMSMTEPAAFVSTMEHYGPSEHDGMVNPQEGSPVNSDVLLVTWEVYLKEPGQEGS